MNQSLLKIVEYHDDNGPAWRLEVITKEKFIQSLIRVENNPSLSEKDCEQYYGHKYEIKCDDAGDFEWCVCPIINNTTLVRFRTDDHGYGNLDINEDNDQPNIEIFERILQDYYKYNHIDIDTSYDAHLEEMKGMYKIPEKDRDVSKFDFLEALYYAYQNNTIDQFYEQEGSVVVCRQCGSETFTFHKKYKKCGYCRHIIHSKLNYDTHKVPNLRIVPPWEYEGSISNCYAHPPKLSWWELERKNMEKEEHLREHVDNLTDTIIDKITDICDQELPEYTIDQLRSITTKSITDLLANKTNNKDHIEGEEKHSDTIISNFMVQFEKIFECPTEQLQILSNLLKSVIKESHC
jgi:hypothetical protein